MGEVLGVGISHFPGFIYPDANMAGRVKQTITSPRVPEHLKDPRNWPAPMQEEWSDDEGARFAAKLECRAFLGFGDHDIPPTPHDDVAFYPASNDVTLYVLRDSAHCHNFASTRAQLWDRIALWASS